MTEEDGVLERLRLGARKGLMDPIHIRLFENNILGAEFNNDGPRVTKLRPLLAEKFPEEYGALKMVPIFDQTAVERLRRLEELTLFEATIDRAALDAQIEVPNYMAGFIQQSREVNSTVFEVVLRAKRGEHLDGEVLKTSAQGLLRFGKALKKLKVRGTDPETDQVDEFDVFRDRVVCEKQMMRIDDEHRTIESASAFRAIELAFNDSLVRIPEVQFIPDE